MSRSLTACCFALLLTGCVDDVVQIGGTGSVYTTRCSSTMEARGDDLVATCAPASCQLHYTSVAENHVVVALDPGRRVVGYAERVCVQDLSKAAEVFNPVVVEEVRVSQDPD